MGNTLLVGVTMASFGLAAPSQPLWVHVVQLAVFGAVNSLQFTAMNTVTLKDLGHDMASSGNSLLSMVQMVAMGMGVAAAGRCWRRSPISSSPPARHRPCKPFRPRLPVWG